MEPDRPDLELEIQPEPEPELDLEKITQQSTG